MDEQVSLCPRTGHSARGKTTSRTRWFLAGLGLGSLIWFLVRVIPKPSRASYPCQRAAAPFAAGFITWIAGLIVSATLFHKVRTFFMSNSWRYAAGLTTVIIIAVVAWLAPYSGPSLQASEGNAVPYKLFDGPLSPVGVARGIAPGRVTWIRDPKAVSWEGKGFWWEDAYNNQAAIDGMVARSIRGLTNQKSDAKAWDAIFRYINRTHGRNDTGYKDGERIAIKANLNNTTDHGNNNRLNTSPHLLLALVRQLTGAAGVKPAAITIFDPSRFIPAYLYDKIHREFPDVVLVDHIGKDGRVKAEFTPNAIPFSVTGRNASGIAIAATEATYLIDAALLKGHVATGVTLCAKNLFGATSIDPDWHNNAHDGFTPKRDGSPSYSAFTDFLGHKDLGEKTVLFVIDALYANDLVDDPPHRKWKMAPFNDAWPASLFLSQDGVAADSVGLDFLRSEWPDLADLSYSDDYMIEAALADNAPSKTVYDPERDGKRCRSLGIHEHWNNAVEKEYSRNLGKSAGIELYTIP
jgi:hypothetical protein